MIMHMINVLLYFHNDLVIVIIDIDYAIGRKQNKTSSWTYPILFGPLPATLYQHDGRGEFRTLRKKVLIHCGLLTTYYERELSQHFSDNGFLLILRRAIT